MLEKTDIHPRESRAARTIWRALRRSSAAALFAIGALLFSPRSATAQQGEASEESTKASDTRTSSSAGELPELSDAPDTGVDPDIELAFSRARSQLEEGNPEGAAWVIRSVFLSTDRFSRAQRGDRRLEARKILLKAARRMESQGNQTGALQAYDAAWVLGDRGVMPDYARLLVRRARNERESDPSEALYLAKRAQRVDSRNDAAGELDRQLTKNPTALPGYVAAAVGVAGLVGAFVLKSRLDGIRNKIESREPKSREKLDSLISKYRIHRTLFGVSVGAAGAGLAAGSLLFSIDVADVRPISPAFLPALPPGD